MSSPEYPETIAIPRDELAPAAAGALVETGAILCEPYAREVDVKLALGMLPGRKGSVGIDQGHIIVTAGETTTGKATYTLDIESQGGTVSCGTHFEPAAGQETYATNTLSRLEDDGLVLVRYAGRLSERVPVPVETTAAIIGTLAHDLRGYVQNRLVPPGYELAADPEDTGLTIVTRSLVGRLLVAAGTSVEQAHPTRQARVEADVDWQNPEGCAGDTQIGRFNGIQRIVMVAARDSGRRRVQFEFVTDGSGALGKCSLLEVDSPAARTRRERVSPSPDGGWLYRTDRARAQPASVATVIGMAQRVVNYALGREEL